MQSLSDDYVVGCICHDPELDVMFTITDIRLDEDGCAIRRADLDYPYYGRNELWVRLPADYDLNPPYLVYYHPYEIY